MITRVTESSPGCGVSPYPLVASKVFESPAQRDLSVTVLMRKVSVSLAIVVFALAAVMFLFGSTQPAVGSAAPPFTLNSQEGKPVSLDQFHGKWVVLYFYPKDFTSGCTLEAHNFQRDLPKYEAAGAAIIGVSVDSVDSHKSFCTKEALDFKLLSDPNGQVSKQYGSLTNMGIAKFASRHTFLIDPQGKIAKVYTEVSPTKHSEDVLQDLAQLQKK
jgi:peroxiredoxin Q/BCP